MIKQQQLLLLIAVFWLDGDSKTDDDDNVDVSDP